MIGRPRTDRGRRPLAVSPDGRTSVGMTATPTGIVTKSDQLGNHGHWSRRGPRRGSADRCPGWATSEVSDITWVVTARTARPGTQAGRRRGEPDDVFTPGAASRRGLVAAVN
jgi:hypothetical protein